MSEPAKATEPSPRLTAKDDFPITREGFRFLKVLAAFMDAAEIDQGPNQNTHPLSQTFEFLEAYLPKVKALEAADTPTAIDALRDVIELLYDAQISVMALEMYAGKPDSEGDSVANKNIVKALAILESIRKASALKGEKEEK